MMKMDPCHHGLGAGGSLDFTSELISISTGLPGVLTEAVSSSPAAELRRVIEERPSSLKSADDEDFSIRLRLTEEANLGPVFLL